MRTVAKGYTLPLRPGRESGMMHTSRSMRNEQLFPEIRAIAKARRQPLIFSSKRYLNIGDVVQSPSHTLIVRRQVSAADSVEWCNMMGIEPLRGRPYYYEMEELENIGS